MVKLGNCKNCGSSKFKISAFVKVIMPFDKYTGEITKEQIADEETKLMGDPTIEVELFCAECGERVQRDINFYDLQTADLCDEIKQRVLDAEASRSEEAMRSYLASFQKLNLSYPDDTDEDWVKKYKEEHPEEFTDEEETSEEDEWLSDED